MIKLKTWLFWPVLFLLFVLSVYSITKINLDENVNKLLPNENGHQLIDFKQFGSLTERIVFITYNSDSSNQNRNLLINYSDELVSHLDSLVNNGLIQSIDYERSTAQSMAMFDIFYDNLPLFLEEQDYKVLDTLFTEHNISNTIQGGYRTLLSPAGMIFRDFFVKDPFSLTQIVLKRLTNLQISKNLTFIDGHMFSADGNKLIFTIVPSATYNQTAANSKLIKHIDHYISFLKIRHPGIEVRYFGAPVVASGNSAQIRRDIALTVSIAILLIFALIYFYFRRFEYAFLILLPAITGGVVALGILALFKDTISVISLGVGAILLGITVDYALHVLNHYKRTNTHTAIYKDLSSPISISALTTIFAFLCLLALNTDALQDLALFAAISIFIAAAFSLFILPQLIRAQKSDTKNAFTIWIDQIALKKISRPVVWIVILLLIASFFIPGEVTFNKNLDDINYMDKRTKEASEMLDPILGVSHKNILLTITGDDLQTTLSTNEKVYLRYLEMKAQREVSGLFGTPVLLRSDSVQRLRINRWQNFWTSEKKHNVQQQIQKESQALGIKVESFNPFYQLISKDFQPLDENLFQQIADTFFPGMIIKEHNKYKIINILKVAGDFEDTVLQQFDNMKSVDAFSKKETINKLVHYLKASFSKLVWFSMAAVFLILLISLGRIELALVGFIPIIMSWVLLLGIMKLFGIHFNIVNIIVSTFIFGLGIDYSIFILKGMMQQYTTGRKNLLSFKKSIILSALTTLIGIGVLLFAKHPALRSIAIIAIPGILSVLVITFTLEPLLFRFLVYKGKSKRWVPLTFMDMWLSFFGIGSFILGSVFASVSVFVISALPLSLKKRKLLLHHSLQKLSWFLIFFRITIKTNFVGDKQRALKKPSLIIVNHQSPLDVPIILSLHPKLIVLTKDWIQNTWIFRYFVKFADFHDMTSGLDAKLLDTLKELVQDGYSIVVFPEGTRSEKGKISRFKKGAFALAEQLKLDIQPILIHGSWRCLPKNEPVVRSGLMTLKFLNRIRYDDPAYGNTLLERSKAFRRLYIKEQKKLQEQIETPSFFRKQLIRNYIYKGPVLEWYLRVKLKLENNYKQLDNIIPKSGLITDLGCGYGFISYMLLFTSEERRITGVDYDCKKIDTAIQCISNSDQIQFICSDITSHPLERSAAFLLIDVLHYFNYQEQEKLLNKCINSIEPEGIILIREGNSKDEHAHKWTLFTEFLSTKITKFNKSGKKLYFTSEKRLREIAEAADCILTSQKDSSVTSNTLYIIKK